MVLTLTQTHGSVQALRCQMASAQRRIAPSDSQPERRETSCGQPALFRGNPVDASHGSAMVGTPQRIRLGFDLLAQAPRLGSGWHVAQAVADLPQGTVRPAENQVGRVFRGRELRFRKKGGFAVGKTKRGKGTKWMVLVDGKGLPLGVSLESASPAEVKLAPRIKREVRGTPTRLIADRAYDSNPFRAQLAKLGTEPIISARSNNRRTTHQDGRKLRRYRQRWVVERTFSWLGWCRRLVVRWERLIEMYRGFFHIALIMLTLRRVLK